MKFKLLSAAVLSVSLAACANGGMGSMGGMGGMASAGSSMLGAMAGGGATSAAGSSGLMSLLGNPTVAQAVLGSMVNFGGQGASTSGQAGLLSQILGGQPQAVSQVSQLSGQQAGLLSQVLTAAQTLPAGSSCQTASAQCLQQVQAAQATPQYSQNQSVVQGILKAAGVQF